MLPEMDLLINYNVCVGHAYCLCRLPQQSNLRRCREPQRHGLYSFAAGRRACRYTFRGAAVDFWTRGLAREQQRCMQCDILMIAGTSRCHSSRRSYSHHMRPPSILFGTYNAESHYRLCTLPADRSTFRTCFRSGSLIVIVSKRTLEEHRN
jgi:hypothetical protein